MQARIPQALVRGAGEPAGERRGALDRLAAAAREGQALRAAPFPPDGRGAPALGPRRPAGHLDRVRRGARRQAHLRQQLLRQSRGHRGQPRTTRSGSRAPAGRAGRSRTRAATAWRGTAATASATSGTARKGRPTCRPCRTCSPSRSTPCCSASARCGSSAGASRSRAAPCSGSCRSRCAGSASRTGRRCWRQCAPDARLRAAGRPGPGLRAAWTPRSFVPAASGERPAVKAGYRRSASGRGLGTRRTRDVGRATALPAVRRSRGAASGARPLGQLTHLILRNNVHAPP